MNESKISVRYAKALFLTGKESNSLDMLKKDIEYLSLCLKEIPELQYIIESPVLKGSEKINMFGEAFKSVFSPLTHKFIRLVLKSRREEYLAGIARYFLSLLRTEQNIQSAEFVTATVIDANIRKSVIQLITKKFNTRVDLQESIDKRLIGGFILRVGDEQIDASIAAKLSHIKKELIHSHS